MLARVSDKTASTKSSKSRLARRNVEAQEQELPNSPEVQPEVEVTNAEIREAVKTLSNVVTNQVEKRSLTRTG